MVSVTRSEGWLGWSGLLGGPDGHVDQCDQGGQGGQVDQGWSISKVEKCPVLLYPPNF